MLKISEILNRNRSTISYYLKEIQNPNCIYKKTRRPPKINDEIKTEILNSVMENRHLSLRDAKSNLASTIISHETIRNVWLKILKAFNNAKSNDPGIVTFNRGHANPGIFIGIPYTFK